MADSTEQKPIEITLGDGTLIKAPTMEEAFKTVAKMKEDTAAELRKAREERDNWKSERDKFAAEADRYRPAVQVLDRTKFDRQHYYELLNSDPVAANDYYFEFRFGQRPDEFTNNYQRMANQLTVMEGQNMGAAFSAQHADDFPGTPEAARSLRERVQILVNEGFPLTLNTMNYAYGQLIDEGSIKPMVKEVESDDEQANPSLSGSSGTVSTEGDYLNRLERMSDKELEAELRKSGMLR